MLLVATLTTLARVANADSISFPFKPLPFQPAAPGAEKSIWFYGSYDFTRNDGIVFPLIGNVFLNMNGPGNVAIINDGASYLNELIQDPVYGGVIQNPAVIDDMTTMLVRRLISKGYVGTLANAGKAVIYYGLASPIPNLLDRDGKVLNAGANLLAGNAACQDMSIAVWEMWHLLGIDLQPAGGIGANFDASGNITSAGSHEVLINPYNGTRLSANHFYPTGIDSSGRIVFDTGPPNLPLGQIFEIPPGEVGAGDLIAFETPEFLDTTYALINPGTTAQVLKLFTSSLLAPGANGSNWIALAQVAADGQNVTITGTTAASDDPSLFRSLRFVGESANSLIANRTEDTAGRGQGPGEMGDSLHRIAM